MLKRAILPVIILSGVTLAGDLHNQQTLKERLGEAARDKNHEHFMKTFVDAKKQGVEENVLREAARRAFTESIYQSMYHESSESIVSFFQNLGVDADVVNNLKEKIETQQAMVAESREDTQEVADDNYGGDLHAQNLPQEPLSLSDIMVEDVDERSGIMRGAAILVSVASLLTIAYLSDQNWNSGKGYKWIYDLLFDQPVIGQPESSDVSGSLSGPAPGIQLGKVS